MFSWKTIAKKFQWELDRRKIAAEAPYLSRETLTEYCKQFTEIARVEHLS